jgi:L-threonylcarbamoyladenylate synthase
MVQKVDWNDLQAIKRIEKSLQSGHVVAGSSDTVIGLLTAATQVGHDALDHVKRRSAMPYLVLVKDLETAKTLSPILQNGRVAQLAHQFWPGPLTLIVPAKKDVPDYMKSASGGIALRVPAHAGLQKLLNKMGALFSTSANFSGEPVPHHINDIDPDILKQVSMIISDEEEGPAIPSTILDCTRDQIKVIREGAVLKERFKDYL